MKKILLLAAALMAVNTVSACPPDKPNCRTGTRHKAAHTLDVYMGGFTDNLYVCEIEILGHQCEGKYQDHNGAADFLTTKNGYNHSSNDPNYQQFIKDGGKKLELSFQEWKDLNKPGTYDETGAFHTQLHLNSYRYGSEYKVSYCYFYKRQTTRENGFDGMGEWYNDPGNDFLDDYGYDQAGQILAKMKMHVDTTDYIDEAKTKVKLSYACAGGGSLHIMKFLRKWPYIVFGEGSSNDFFLVHDNLNWSNMTDKNWKPGKDTAPIMVPLDIDSYGGCKFTFHFKEGKVGKIRKYNEPGTIKSFIKTKVDVKMNLIDVLDYMN